MDAGKQGTGEGIVASTARVAERGLVLTRAIVSQILDSLQLRLRAIEVSREPEVKAWAARMRSLVERGEIDHLLKAQPENPRVLIDRRRSEAS